MAWMFAAAAAVALISIFLTGAVLHFLRRRAILDHPNERSSHDTPTPRGGGVAVVVAVAAGWLLPPFGTGDTATVVAIMATAGLAAISWIDDIRSLNPPIRLAAQFAAAGAAVFWFDGAGPVFQGLLPPVPDAIAATVILVWFVNLFNFMDGIDAMSVSESVAICLGLTCLALMRGVADLPPWLPLALAAAMLGFLVWNRPPAKVFLGDVGSIPIGFLLGWMLLKAAAAGYWAAALILPLYYLADATITLARRAARGEKVWRAHREHFYQRAVQSGRSHAAVSGAVFGTGLILVLIALATLDQPALGLSAAGVAVGILMYWMRR